MTSLELRFNGPIPPHLKGRSFSHLPILDTLKKIYGRRKLKKSFTNKIKSQHVSKTVLLKE